MKSQKKSWEKRESFIPLTALFLLFKKRVLYFYFALCPVNYVVDSVCSHFLQETTVLTLEYTTASTLKLKHKHPV